MPQIISVEKIWSHAPHNAFTDLIRFRDRWWCVFREAQAHDAPGGIVRVLASETGAMWKSAATVEERGIDLRDPKLSVTPDGRLMLLMGGCVYDDEGEYLTRAPRVSFSEDGATWSDPRKVLAEDHWLWRATWHGDRAYSLSKLGEGKGPRRGFLYSSADGIDWVWITEFKLPGVSETTLGFHRTARWLRSSVPATSARAGRPIENGRFARLRSASVGRTSSGCRTAVCGGAAGFSPPRDHARSWHA